MTNLNLKHSSFDSVALLIPCQNGRAYLDTLAGCIRGQVRTFDELLLFDDASTDGSGEYAKQLGFTVLRSDQPIGPAAARNRLAEIAKSRWLHFHDVDDLLAPDYTARVLAVADDQANLIICDMCWIDALSGKSVGDWCYDESAIHQQSNAYFIRHSLGGINGLYCAKTFQEVGGFDVRRIYWEDLDLAMRWPGTHGMRVVPLKLVTALRRPTSYSNSNLPRVWNDKIDLLIDLLEGSLPGIRGPIAGEAEQIAVRLLHLSDRVGAQRALQLACRAGGDPPTSTSGGLRLLKQILPRLWCLQLQEKLRQQLSASPLPLHP